MSDNPRPQLYDARYTALSASRADEPVTEVVSVAVDRDEDCRVP